jgi:hypothetical protein
MRTPVSTLLSQKSQLDLIAFRAKRYGRRARRTTAVRRAEFHRAGNHQPLQKKIAAKQFRGLHQKIEGH